MPWVCTTDSKHVFTSPTKDYFCPSCPPYGGILMDMDSTPNATNNNDTIVKNAGLYIFLLDASGSMFSEEAFPGTPINRAQLVSGQVANALWSMSNLTNKSNAYVLILLFDHNIRPFINFLTVEQIFTKYPNIQDLQADLYSTMESLKGATDINLALESAYNYAQMFVNGSIDNIGKVEPMINWAINTKTGDDFEMPNIRCLIFTDGQHYTGKGGEIIKGNPFTNFHYKNKTCNILMGAFHGTSNDPGYTQLRHIIANCPIHDEKQFFHFSNPEHIMRMRSLFRMGSGPSGYCEKCLNGYIRENH